MHLAIWTLAINCARAFYIPGWSVRIRFDLNHPLTLLLVGWSIRSYKDDEPIPLLVNKVYSDNTQLQYAYYDLPFVCPPTGKKHRGSAYKSGHSISLNLGEILRGDRIMTSDYELVMGQDQECRYLCSHDVDRKGVKRAQELMAGGYLAEWIVDNLPGATSFVTVDNSRKYYAAGFKIGFLDFLSGAGKPRYFIHNHLIFVIRWRKAPGKAERQGGKVIVGFEVYTKSIGAADRGSDGCPSDVHNTDKGMELYIAPNNTNLATKYPHSSYLPAEDDVDDGATLTIPYSYSVYFREDRTIDWANRWDRYFVNQQQSSRIHWLAIFNSLVLTGFLTIAVAVVLAKTSRGDINGHTKDAVAEEGKIRLKRKIPSNRSRSPRIDEKTSHGLLEQHADVDHDADISSDEDFSEDLTGWKLLHGDVFRAPPHSGLLAPLVGSGMQLLFMTMGLLLLSCVGILNPSFRGGFISVGMGLFVFAGVFSGYFSGRVYKTFGGLKWRENTLRVRSFRFLRFLSLLTKSRLLYCSQAYSSSPFSSSTFLCGLRHRAPPSHSAR